MDGVRKMLGASSSVQLYGLTHLLFVHTLTNKQVIVSCFMGCHQ